MKEVEQETLLQTKSEMRFTPDDVEALGYLVQQFPKEYKTDEKAKAAPIPSQASIEAKEKKEMNDYSQQVAEEANDYSK
jgi:hypothetical protein